MKAALQNPQTRMQRVLNHIDRHLDEDLDLDTLSNVAAYSKHHFHRQFTAIFGLSVHRYIQLARMTRASYRLAYREGESVTDIAMDAGYDAPDAFARAFRQRLGQSPSSFRRSPDWEPWFAAFGPLDNARSKFMEKTFGPEDVTIREVPPRRWRSWSIGATRQRSAPPSKGSSPGARPRASTPRPVRPSMSSVPSGVLGRRPTTAWTSASGSIDRSRRRASRSNSAGFPAGAARCCVWSATPTIWSLPRSISIATGFRPAARQYATSRSIASG